MVHDIEGPNSKANNDITQSKGRKRDYRSVAADGTKVSTIDDTVTPALVVQTNDVSTQHSTAQHSRFVYSSVKRICSVWRHDWIGMILCGLSFAVLRPVISQQFRTQQGDAYYMLGDFNHHHQHAVLAGDSCRR